MILVTLGTQDKSFDRLLNAVQKQIDLKNITDKVVVQAGTTHFESNDMEIHSLIPVNEFDSFMNKCDILITHGGVGSIVSGIKNGKKVIAAARLAEFKEHTNDHQKQIIKEFVDMGYILELDDFDDLDKKLEELKNFKPKKFKSNTNKMVNLVKENIDNLLK